MVKPPGLQNIGNTCYFNAVIQSLYRTDVFVDNLQNAGASTNTPNNADSSSVSLLEEDTENERPANFRLFFDRQYSKLQHLDLKYLFTRALRVACFVISYRAGSSEMFNRNFFAKLLRNVRAIIYSNVSTVALCTDGFKGHSSPLTFWQHLNLTRTCPLEVTVNPTSFCWYIFPMAIILLAVAYKLLHWTKWRCSCLKKKQIATLFCLSFFCYYAGYLATFLQHSSTLAPYTRGAPALTAFICFAFYYRSKILSSLRWLHSIDLRSPNSNNESVSSSLSKLFQEMNSGKRTGSLNPELVLKGVCRRAERFYGFRQQDSHDLLRHLLDGIREDGRQLKQQRNLLTLVDKVFGGHFRTEYNCLGCGTPHVLYESFLDISLPILIHEDTWNEIEEDYVNKMDRNSSSGYPIEFLLKVFTRTENLGKEYLCTACNAGMTGDEYMLTEGKKQTLICDVPAILCIHLKRFKQLASGQGFEKANNPVQFSELLDLKQYLSAKCQRINDGQENVWYSLYAVVVHSGSLEGGHYTAYIKSKQNSKGNIERFLQEDGCDWDQIPENTVSSLQGASSPLTNVRLPQALAGGSQWYYTSDSTVRAVDRDEVFKQQAYLLFYERLC